MTESHDLADLVTETTYADISSDAVAHAKRSVRDFVGVAVYGSHHDVGDSIMSYLDALPAGGESSVLGRGTLDPPRAALANGTFGHAIDYDDTFESVVIHPSGSVFPAALAVAEQEGKSGRDVLTSYVVGVEVLFRLGQSVAPSHWRRGWHSTGTIGAFGATAAAASVLGLPADDVRRAFGIAGSSASGMRKNAGTMTKPLHSGHAAQMGVRAALLARGGFTGSETVLEGEAGFGSLYTTPDGYDPTPITAPDRESWAILDNGFKPYPSGVVTHAPMEALRQIVVRENLAADDVDSITVTVDEQLSDEIFGNDPESALEAKFSYEFCLAAVLREGDAGIHEFTDEYVRQDATREQMAKVERNPVPSPFGEESVSEASYGAIVEVVSTGGESYTEQVRHAPGSPTNPITDDRLEAKFFECAETVLSRARAERVAEAIADLEESGSLDRLTAAAVE